MLAKRLPAISFITFIFVGLLFFLPLGGFSLEVSKALFVGLVGLVLGLLFFINSLKEKEIEFPVSSVMMAILAIPVVYLLSALLAPAMTESLLGVGIAVETALFMFVMAVVAVMTAVLFQKHQHVWWLFTALFGAFLFLFIFFVVRFIGGVDVLSLSYFSSLTSTPFGSWSEVGIFSSLIALLSLTALSTFNPRTPMRIFLGVIIVAAFLFMLLVNSTLLWLIFLLIGVILFVVLWYKRPATESLEDSLSESTQNESSAGKTRGMPTALLVALIVALLVALSGSLIGDELSRLFGINYLSVRPSLAGTLDLFSLNSIKEALLGVGPNRFFEVWAMNKPAAVNATQFWNADFSYGFGLLPTALVTTGLLGIIAWLALAISLIWLLVKIVARVERLDTVPGFLIISSTLGSLLLLVSVTVFVPGVSTLLLLFTFIGLTVAAGINAGLTPTRKFSTQTQDRSGFVILSTAVVLTIVSVLGLYYGTRSAVAHGQYASAVRSLVQSGELNQAAAGVTRALRWSPRDEYARLLSNVYVSQLASLAQDEEVTEDVAVVRFQNTASSAVSSAQLAVNLDAQDYRNHLALGNVYAQMARYGVEGSLDQARTAYSRVAELSPKNPSVPLLNAQLDLIAQNVDSARENIAQALEMKPNYTQALLFQAQLNEAEGDVEGALSSLAEASLAAPTNTGVFFEIGRLRYQNEDYQGAIPALERSVILNPFNVNAKYLLGLSYQQVGRTEEANLQFDDLRQLFPENEAVQQLGTEPVSTEVEEDTEEEVEEEAADDDIEEDETDSLESGE